MRRLAIIERDREFSEALKKHLTTKLLGWEIEILPLIPRRANEYNYLIVEESLCMKSSLQNMTSRKIILLSKSLNCSDPARLYRIKRDLKITEIAASIIRYITDQNTGNDHPLILLNTFEAHLRLTHRSMLLRDYAKAEYQIFYLPLMPLYRIPFALQQTKTGGGIADFLLKLDCGLDCDWPDFAECFEDLDILRLPKLDCGLEDLCNLSDQLLHRLIKLFRELVKYQKKPTLGLIETSDISLKKVQQISNLVDRWYSDVPNNLSFGSQIARREMASIIANLPQHTVFTDISA